MDLLFADAAGWSRPIRFAGGVGGHAPALDVASQAQKLGVRRLIFAHIGKPTIRAIDQGAEVPFGEFGSDQTSAATGSDRLPVRPAQFANGVLVRRL